MSLLFQPRDGAVFKYFKVNKYKQITFISTAFLKIRFFRSFLLHLFFFISSLISFFAFHRSEKLGKTVFI